MYKLIWLCLLNSQINNFTLYMVRIFCHTWENFGGEKHWVTEPIGG